MDIQRVYRRGPYPKFVLCGEYWDYGLFRTRKPKQVAIDIIHDRFGDDVGDKFFLYWVRTYRGHNNLQDIVEVYYKKKLI